MGAEFIAVTGGGSAGGEHITGHNVSITLVGEKASLVPRLEVALERLGYLVISEQPLRATHGPRGWGMVSANILDYPRTLMIGFKPIGEQTTRVTFSYTIRGMKDMFTRGDLQSLTREAEAIATITSRLAASARCAACGAEGTTDSRFCRRCGAMLSNGEAPELDVVHLTASGRAAHQTIVTGAILLALLFIVLILLQFVTKVKLLAVLGVFGTILGLLGGLMLAFGLRRLNRTLFDRIESETAPMESHRLITGASTTEVLQSHPPQSVTEGTTELLDSEASPGMVHSHDKEISTEH